MSGGVGALVEAGVIARVHSGVENCTALGGVLQAVAWAGPEDGEQLRGREGIGAGVPGDHTEIPGVVLDQDLCETQRINLVGEVGGTVGEAAGSESGTSVSDSFAQDPATDPSPI